MSLVSNGDYSDSRNTPICFVECGRRNSLDNEEKNSSPEAEFKGFAKLPAVLLQPIDITPYLNSKNVKCLESNKKNTAKHPVNIDKFMLKCSVNVVRSDLEKLKEAVLRGDSVSEMVDSMNVINMKCKICEKVYSSEKKLQNHQAKKHMIVYKPSTKPKKRVSFSDKVIVHEVKEYHRCRKCTKIFESYRALKLHMKLKHKKRKCYICNYCSKKFVDRMFFKVHIKLHCDRCGLLLPNRSSYVQHRRNICRVVKLHKCKTCDDIFFRFMDLKDHSYDHMNTFYVCDICKDQLNSKCALAHHIYFLHSKKRPTLLYIIRNIGTERLYLCRFCEESSVDRDLIENHVQLLPDLYNRVMTGYKDYYFCDQCFKQFDTETAMLQHKWTHFLKTSDNSQVRQKTLTNKKKEIKLKYRLDEKIPDSFQPKVVLDRIKVGGQTVTDSLAFIDVNSFDVRNGEINKPVVDQKSKKTIISKHQCQTCGKYYISNYNLVRHINTQHSDYENLKCKVCEEVFVWPSLLQSHKCIRLKLPEMPFQDARPEIHFDNFHEITPFEDFAVADSEDFTNAIDFEIPAPIVELTEFDGRYCNSAEVPVSNGFLNQSLNDKFGTLPNTGYTVVMQEVPIEF